MVFLKCIITELITILYIYLQVSLPEVNQNTKNFSLSFVYVTVYLHLKNL